jgi:hypothetical protein
MRFLFTVIVAALVIWQGGIYYDLDSNSAGWLILILGGAGLGIGLIAAAIISGIFQSFQMEIRLLTKYIKNKDAVFEDPDKTEPAALGFMSGRWLLVLIHLVRDTWKGFFTEIQWAYRGSHGMTDEEVIHGRNINNPIVQDDLEGEYLYREWAAAHSSGEKIRDFFKLRIINGTVFVIIGSVLALIFSMLLVTVGVLSLPYVLVFVVAWFVDRIYLIIRKIAQPCGNCQSKNTILYYECPKCGRVHKHLVSGPYGVFRHKCKCGQKLPCTFFNGRSIKAKPICPCCGNYIKGAGTRPFMIQMIGGSNSGKTVYISAFYHEFLEKVKKSQYIDYEVDKDDENLFVDLEDWYMGVPCESTKRMNSQMYPVQLYSNQLDVARKFILYDIAGEMFNSGKADAEINQKQFHYCNGIVFILDPFSNNSYRKEMEQIGERLPQYSDIESGDVVNTFLNYMAKTGNKSVGSVFQMPFSVVITKADVKAIRQRINMVKIKAEFNKNPGKYASIDEARDSMCKEFLEEIGLAELTSIIDTRFKKVHYFLASPMGHEPDDSAFDSWGVLEPIDWIIKEQDEKLYNLVEGNSVTK